MSKLVIIHNSDKESYLNVSLEFDYKENGDVVFSKIESQSTVAGLIAAEHMKPLLEGKFHAKVIKKEAKEFGHTFTFFNLGKYGRKQFCWLR